MPQPSRHTLFKGALGFTLAREISATTVYSEKVLQPIKWKRLLPLQEKRLVPSGIRPRPWVILREGEVGGTVLYQGGGGSLESFHAQVLPDLLTQVGFGVFAELAFPTLRDVQWNHSVP